MKSINVYTLDGLFIRHQQDYYPDNTAITDIETIYQADNVAISLSAIEDIETYTIENGVLVKASEAIIDSRKAIRLAAQRDAIRVQREARYNSEAISSLYWNWVESGVKADKQLWIDAKNAVRAELPYPEEKRGGE